MKLNLDIKVEGRTISGHITYMEESLRNTGLLIECNGFTIKSIGSPELRRNALYVRGYNLTKDNKQFMCTYSYVKEAKEAYCKILTCVNLLNGSNISGSFGLDVELQSSNEGNNEGNNEGSTEDSSEGNNEGSTEDSKKKLDVELFRYGTLLFGKILYQHPSLTGKVNLPVKGKFVVSSVTLPELERNTLYIRGSNSSADDREISLRCESEEATTEVIADIKICLDIINGPQPTEVFQDTGIPDVVRVI